GVLEEAFELRARLGLSRLVGGRRGERRAAEVEVLAEVAARLVLHRLGHRLRALVVVARVPVPAVAAAAQVVAAGFALAVARDRPPARGPRPPRGPPGGGGWGGRGAPAVRRWGR